MPNSFIRCNTGSLSPRELIGRILFSGNRPESACFSSLAQKNFIQPLFINKEYLKSQFNILGFVLEGNLLAIWDILYFSGY